MASHVTSFFATPPDARIRDVAEKLNAHIGAMLDKGYVLHSVHSHAGIVDGVSCTVGYMIVALPRPDDDKLPIVIAA